MFCVYFSFPTNPIPPVASEPPSPTRPADLGKRIDGPELGRQNKRGTLLLLSCPGVECDAQAQAFGLAHPFVSRRRNRRGEKRGGPVGPLPPYPPTLLRCNTTDESPQGGCVGETPDFTELRVCWCPVGLRSGIPPSLLLSLFGLRFLPCIPTISALLFFPPSSPPANKASPPPPPPGSRPAEPGPSPRNGNSWFPWPPHRTALHRIIITHRHRHTGTGTRRRPDRRNCVSVPPACPFRVFPYPIIGV